MGPYSILPEGKQNIGGIHFVKATYGPVSGVIPV